MMRRQFQRQRGVAVITALLLTTLAVTIVASLFWQQQVQVRSMENQRLHLQTKWIVRGAMDWARLILHQSGVDNQGLTTLDGVWATPLAETRMDQYIERDRVEGETFDATLSGHVTDAQARYNLNKLATQRQIDKNQVKVFESLLRNLGLDGALAMTAAQGLARSQLAPPQGQPAPQGNLLPPMALQADSAPLDLIQLDDLLALPGYTPDVVAKLRDFVVVLPAPAVGTPGPMTLPGVNANTAPAEVLAAVLGVPLSQGQSLVQARKQAPFNDPTKVTLALGITSTPAGIDVKSDYFLVYSKVRLERAALDAEALIWRQASSGGRTTLVWIREN